MKPSLQIIEIFTPDHPGVKPYISLTERQLSQQGNSGIFIAESPKVISVALRAGFRPLSLLCEKKHLTGDASTILDFISQNFPESFTIYTGSREILASLTGYKLTRGVLCAMQRPKLPTINEVCRDAQRIAVLEGICDTTNIGAIFRSAAALGIDAVLLTRGTCDPLNRRAVRVSMGTVFLVPWTWIDNPAETLHAYGFKTVALALNDNSVSIDDPELCSEPRLAMVLGTEGDGLASQTISECDYTAKIPMSHCVDSLNVAAASAVAFWQLRVR